MSSSVQAGSQTYKCRAVLGTIQVGCHAQYAFAGEAASSSSVAPVTNATAEGTRMCKNFPNRFFSVPKVQRVARLNQRCNQQKLI
jgi:hypothetical protein